MNKKINFIPAVSIIILCSLLVGTVIVLITLQMKDAVKISSFEEEEVEDEIIGDIEEEEGNEEEEKELDMDLEIIGVDEKSGWNIVGSKNYSFEIMHSSEYTLNKYRLDKTIVSSQCYNSSVERIYIEINKKDNTPADCLKEKVSLPISNKEYLKEFSLKLTEEGWPETKEIDGVDFYRRNSGESAMGGKSTEYFSYQTFHNNVCYSVGIEVYSDHSFGFADECPTSLRDSSQYESLRKEETEKTQEIFFPILSTFRFID